MTLDPAHFALIAAAGFFINVFAAIVGGGLFFAVPFMQWMFPDAVFGVLMGNTRVGWLFRSLGSSWSIRRHIAYAQNIKVSAFALVGAALGSSLIADLDQKWLFPAVILAVVFVILSPRVAHLVTARTFNLAAFLTGLYAGIFGAGTGLMLIALLRLKYVADTDIAFVKIQAHFVEMLLVAVAVLTHFLHGNIVSVIWIPWSIGSLGGGTAGGFLLEKIGHLTGRTQAYILYAAFAVSITVAGIKFFS